MFNLINVLFAEQTTWNGHSLKFELLCLGFIHPPPPNKQTCFWLKVMVGHVLQQHGWSCLIYSDNDMVGVGLLLFWSWIWFFVHVASNSNTIQLQVTLTSTLINKYCVLKTYFDFLKKSSRWVLEWWASFRADVCLECRLQKVKNSSPLYVYIKNLKLF